ncbi:hypothetical protein JXL83_06855 [candidate division WOR-3 bacterium]|nr:hypothetical protein [candidate division WOR-3 bacterium]
MAKNLSQYSVWGVDKTDFTSSSSSPLWTLLITFCFVVFGVNELSPFLLNLFFSVILILTINFFIIKNRGDWRYNSLILTSVVFFTPLYSLVFTGLEHVLHILLITLLLFVSKKVLVENKNVMRIIPITILAVATRYESLFIIFVLSLILLVKKRYLSAVILLIISILPIIVYGLVSMGMGWSFFPNPVHLKGNFSGMSFNEFSKLFNRLIEQSILTPHLMVLFLSALIFLLLAKKVKYCGNSILLTVFVLTTVIHLIFARVGWFFRYEAYLVIMGILALSLVIYELFPVIRKTWTKTSGFQKAVVFLSIAVFLIPLVRRACLGLNRTHRASKNIYEQQYQMGLFVKEFYSGETVLLNDIGAVCFLSDIKCVDVWGMANYEVMCLKNKGIYCTDDFERLANENDGKIAVVYVDWLDFFGGVPDKWIKVGKWRIKDNIVAAREEVDFFAFDSQEAVRLKNYLALYKKNLPEDVDQTLY